MLLSSIFQITVYTLKYAKTDMITIQKHIKINESELKTLYRVGNY